MHTGEKSQVSPKGGCGKVDLKKHELLQKNLERFRDFSEKGLD